MSTRGERAWDAFWFVSGSPAALAIFRVLFAIGLAAELQTSRAKCVNALADGRFHLPYTAWIPPVPEPLYPVLHTLELPLIALVALGLGTRVALAGLLTLQGWLFFADRLNFRNHPYLFLLLLGILLFSPADEALSLGALLRRARGGAAGVAARPLTAQRLIQFQIAFVYLASGLHKLHGYYLAGHVLPTFLPGLAPTLARVAAPLTVALELGLPVAIFVPATRIPAIVVGVLFHAVIALVLGIGTFSWVMCGSYVLFLDPKIPQGWLERLPGPGGLP